MSFIKAFDHSLLSKYELVLLSPRNYFVYTPLLPAMCAGTVEERSIVEPVRAVLKSKVRWGFGTHRPAPSGLLGRPVLLGPQLPAAAHAWWRPAGNRSAGNRPPGNRRRRCAGQVFRGQVH